MNAHQSRHACGWADEPAQDVVVVSACDRSTAKANINRIIGGDLFQSSCEPEKIYVYRDSQDRAVFEKLRCPGKQFRQRRQTEGGFVWNLDGVKKPLYHLPEVLTANEPFVCEGEEDTDRPNTLNLQQKWAPFLYCVLRT